jgi:hypothetical protein
VQARRASTRAQFILVGPIFNERIDGRPRALQADEIVSKNAV